MLTPKTIALDRIASVKISAIELRRFSFNWPEEKSGNAKTDACTLSNQLTFLVRTEIKKENKLYIMEKFTSICRNILLMGFVMMTLTLTAQSKKVLIVSLEDTTMVHGHRGFTAITNFKDTLRIDLPLSKFIEEKLAGYLNASFETQIINAPDEIKKNAFGFWGQGKEYKNWIKEAEKGYDYLIIVHNIDISNGTISPAMPSNTSGFFSGGPAHGVFTTISFDAYQIANNQKLEYDNWGCKTFVMMKKFKMPEDKRTFDNQMLETIKNELIQLIDYKIKFFLTETSLIPNLE